MGLAERRRHPEDRRKHAVYLTARGRRTLARARKAAMEMAQDVFAPLDARRARDTAPAAAQARGRRGLNRDKVRSCLFVSCGRGQGRDSADVSRGRRAWRRRDRARRPRAGGVRRAGQGSFRGADGRHSAAANADYWEFADWLQPAMDRLWNESQNVYTNDTRINASRADDPRDRGARGPRGRVRAATSGRASWRRACARRRRSAGARDGRPTRHSDPRSESQLPRSRAGSRASRERDSSMHLSVDPKVARALYYAWRAREQLRPRPGARSRGWSRACARSPTRRSSATRTSASTRSTSRPSCTPARSA